MEIKKHPTFEKMQNNFIAKALVFFALTLFLLMFLDGKISDTLSLVFFWIFFFSFAFTWYYGAFVRPSNVVCPNCSSQTIHKTQKPEGFMVAICKSCKIKWNLGDRFSND